ncbi:MAG: hypothetical protein GOMPHAMPRED_001436 [Gomphillus americanus]|uniref:Uncharacterized protein n=1 Tax=Gomphillus americanus TaxID=1940652 RepID=A0A8H3F8T4_9LECA|nr:MAG: hypothetical protein GOMPHAMPRED_001436 [Gomphillus americanus]
MCEAIQSSVLTNSRHETIEAWSERDRRLLAQLCVPKPRSWSHIIVAFQQNAEHFRSAEAITKQWDLVESSEPNLVQEVQDCMDLQGNQHPIQTEKTQTATSSVTETVELARDTEDDEDLALNAALIDDEELRQEQFYVLQHYMDSVLICEEPSQIVARLKREERDL